MVECKDCKGTGKVNITVNWIGGEDDGKSDSSDITCVDCNGKGELTEAEAKAIKDHEDDWCDCDEEYDVDFFEDGEHPDCHKHHYRCQNCGGIYQIG